jgi:CSLREA domain-containing protein
MRARSFVAASALLLALLGCGDNTESPMEPASIAPEATALAAAGQRIVNSLADPGDGTCDARQCTLREAVEDPGSTAISFAPGLTGPITLARPAAGGGTLVIDRELTITGPGAGLVVQRRTTDPAFRILRIGKSGVVALTNLNLRNGQTDLPGGGIINFGSLTLTRCTVANNASTQRGGGIDNHGPLTVTDTRVANNSGQGGTGIDNHNNGTLTVTQSTITRNSGAGVVNDGSTVVIRGSTVSYNSVGISASRGTLTLDRVRVLNNAGRGIFKSKGVATLTNSTVARNSGGGIANVGGTFTITRSTVADNSTTGPGGGVFNTVENIYGRGSANLTITNRTVSGNSAGSGGGIQNSDDLGGAFVGLTNTTVAFNSAQEGGGGIGQAGGVESGNAVRLTNTVVAQNSAPAGPDAYNLSEELNFVDASFSLIGNGSGSGIANTDGNQVGNGSPNSSPIDPKLGALANNGGPTQTHALLAGSPALDAASSEGCPAIDQRGVARPQGPACDVGSYERE